MTAKDATVTLFPFFGPKRLVLSPFPDPSSVVLANILNDIPQKKKKKGRK
jgi:hypothetical protein